MTGYSHGGYDDFSWTRADWMWDSVSLPPAMPGGDGGRVLPGAQQHGWLPGWFSLWGGHVLVGKSFAGGLFVEVWPDTGRCLKTTPFRESWVTVRQGEKPYPDFRYSGRVEDHTAPLDMTITPTVSLNGARVTEIVCRAGSGAWSFMMATPLAEGRGWGRKSIRKYDAEGRIWRNITLKDMPGMTLRDDWKPVTMMQRRLTAIPFRLVSTEADGETVSAGKSKQQFWWLLKTDAEGILGIRYNFW